MAKSKTAPGVKTRTAAIEQDAKAGRYPEAWHAARQLWAEEQTDAHAKLMQLIVKQACQAAIDAGSPGDYAKTIQWANMLPAGASREWTITLAHLQAKAGYLTAAKKLLEPLNDPQAMLQALAFAADKSILARQAELLPEEHRPAYRAVLAAFDQYHTGNDAAARESLNAVGLQSPYLDWKVLIRGLIAYSAKDDARAIENFQRLNAERLPGRLAKAFRANIDPAYRQQLAPETMGTLDRCYQAMVPSSLAEKVRTIRRQCHPGKSLAEAFTTVQSVLPQIKAHRPELKEKLAHCMYYVLVNMGQPDDLKRFLKAFGPPTQDPDFHRLQGAAFEQAGALELSLPHWKHYAEWLRKVPAGWHPELAKRARAHVLLRAGNVAADVTMAGEMADDDEPDFIDIFSPPVKKKKPSKAKALAQKAEADPLPLLKEAVAAAPDWEDPVLALMELYRERKDDKAAETVANEYLARSPASLPILKLLVKVQAAEHRPAQLCETWKRILALNPLDEDALHETTQAHVALARLHAVAKNMPACTAALKEAARLNDNHGNYAMLALDAALAVQRGEDDAAILAPMQGEPAPMLVAKYLRQVYSVLLKFKPAMKKAAAAAFTEALQTPPEPIALGSLWVEVDRIAKEGWKFTGEATLRKKVLAAILASPKAADEEEFNILAALLQNSGEWATLQKFAAKLGKFYPRNPLYPFLEACAYRHFKPLGKYDQKVLRMASKAEMILEMDPNSKYEHLLPEIQQMVDDFRPDYSFFESFFGRR